MGNPAAARKVVLGFFDPLEERRLRYSYLQASQSRVRQAAENLKRHSGLIGPSDPHSRMRLRPPLEPSSTLWGQYNDAHGTGPRRSRPDRRV